ANKRLERMAPTVAGTLSHQNGAILSHPTTILLLGTDHMNNDQRVYDFHSDSIMLLRTDPGKHRLAYLSIPRDLPVDLPRHGPSKINSAMQIGGPALAVKRIETFTGLPVTQVMVINFHDFRKLIDNIGGITINVPEPILSNPFDCPYTAQRCKTWKGWRFAKGKQHMNGWRAQIYSRIRENQLNPADTDITRGERQQQGIRAVQSKLGGFGTFFCVPFNRGPLVGAPAADLSAWQFVQLGRVLKRSPGSNALHCRLGGSSDSSGTSDIIPSEENRSVIGEVTGAAAPQPPNRALGFFAPGCYVGSTGPTR